MNIRHPHEHKLLKPRFIALGLSFRLHFQQQFISPSFSTMRFLHPVAVLLSPGFAYNGTQSTFHLSHRGAASPEWKCTANTIVFEDFVRMVVMAYGGQPPSSTFSWQNLRFFALIFYNFRHPTKSKILSLRFLFGQLKTKQNCGIVRRKMRKVKKCNSKLYYTTLFWTSNMDHDKNSWRNCDVGANALYVPLQNKYKRG